MIKYIKPFGSSTYNIRIGEVYAGELAPKEDGYWDWYPELRPGYIPSWVLRSIADKLDELNKDWDEQVKLDVS
jgi:hypothetical protein